MSRIFRRITFVFNRDFFHERKHEGVRLEEQKGVILEDLEVNPGTAAERGLTKPIAEHLRAGERSMVGAIEDPAEGLTWTSVHNTTPYQTRNDSADSVGRTPRWQKQAPP